MIKRENLLKRLAFRQFSNLNFSKDYYKILGVQRTATKSEIRKAYLNLAKVLHPDSATGDEEKFKQLGEAYEVLSNENTRNQYNSGFGKPKENTEKPYSKPKDSYDWYSKSYDRSKDQK